MTDDLIGKSIGGYVIEGQIGRGGMATVYLARQTSMNRVVALKVLPKNLSEDGAYAKRFEREVAIVAQLEHRSIVPVYDHGTFDGQPYIAMRYMAGGSLDQHLARGPLAAEQVLNVYTQIAPALDYAHSKNVLHRDLKPSNILLDETGGAFLTDFGIARLIGDENPGHTITAQGVVGTPSYMSPEQAQGQPLDGRSDLYALGIMLFELLCGRRPFMSDTPYSIAVMQVTATPPSARAINPDVTPAVEQVIFKSLKKKPEERYPTAVEMVAALRTAIESPGGFNPHDTQPNRRSNIRDTQPMHPQPGGTIYLTPHAPAFTPQRPPSDYMPAPVSVSQPSVRPVRRRPPGASLWMNMTIGAAIGCGLLAIIGFVIVVVAAQLLDRINAPSSAGVTPTAATAEPSLSPTDADAATVAPIGVRDPMDGSIIYVVEIQRGDGPITFQIASQPLSGTAAPTQLTDDESRNVSPAISPDGQRIAFISDRDGDRDLYVMDIGGGGVQKLLDTQVNEFTPAWTPDGAALIVASDTRGDGATDLLRVASDGSGAFEVLFADNALRAGSPAVSPDGTTVAFVLGGPRDARTWEIARLDLSTRQLLSDVTDDDVRDGLPVYSRSGVLYWMSTIDGASTLYRQTTSGGAEAIYETDLYISGLQASPSGELLMLQEGAAEDPAANVVIFDPSDRTTEALDIGYAPEAAWAP